MSSFKDLTGERFGRLTVIERAENHVAPSGKITARWKCVCDCGNETIMQSNNLRSSQVKSCGCMQIERGKEAIKNEKLWEKCEEYTQNDRKENTRITCIKENRAMRSDNTSGVRGVSWDRSREKWEAHLRLRGKNHHLGRFASIDDAIKARKDAEQKYFRPILERYNDYSELEVIT